MTTPLRLVPPPETSLTRSQDLDLIAWSLEALEQITMLLKTCECVEDPAPCPYCFFRLTQLQAVTAEISYGAGEIIRRNP